MRKNMFLLATVAALGLAFMPYSGAEEGTPDPSTAWAEFNSGLLAVGGEPGAPFYAIDTATGALAADGWLAEDGFAMVAANVSGDGLVVDVAGELVQANEPDSDRDWNW